MAQYTLRLRRTSDGQTVAYLPMVKSYQYMELNLAVNDVGNINFITADGWINDVRRLFAVRNLNESLDYVMEVWRTPRRIRSRNLGGIRRIGQFLLRASRSEHLVNGLPRTTPVFRDPMDFLNRPLIYPPGETYDGYDNMGLVDPSIPIDPPLPQFTGLAAPADTAFQMHETFRHTKAYRPEPLTAVTNGVPALANGNAGIIDHRISARFDRLISFLKKMSDASWYANYYGLSPNPPVDFSVVPLTLQPLAWEFRTFVGGLGQDRRIGNTAGNTPVILSPTTDSVIQPVSNVNRTSERTSMIVAGEGDDTTRDTIRVLNTDAIAHSPWNHIEEYLQLGNVPALPGGLTALIERGRAELSVQGVEDVVTAILSKNEHVIWPVDVDLGDLISLSFNGAIDDYQVVGLKIQLFNHQQGNSGYEEVTLELSPPNGTRHGANAQSTFQDILDKIHEDIKKEGEDTNEVSNR